MTDATSRKFDSFSCDAGQIERWVAHILQQEYGFEQLFVTREINPLCLTYESLAQSPESVVQAIAGHLMVGLPMKAVESVHRPISAATSREWTARFSTDRADFVEGWTEYRGCKAVR